MNLKKVIACALLCGMLFFTIPVEAIKIPIDSDAEVDTSESDSEADAQPDTSNRFFSLANGNRTDFGNSSATSTKTVAEEKTESDVSSSVNSVEPPVKKPEPICASAEDESREEVNSDSDSNSDSKCYSSSFGSPDYLSSRSPQVVDSDADYDSSDFETNSSEIEDRIKENKLASDDDFKSFCASFVRLITYLTSQYSSNEEINEIFTFLESATIEEKISTASMPEEQKEYLRNSINLVKYVYDENSRECCNLRGLFSLGSLIFDPEANFNQVKGEYRKKFIVFMGNELKKRGDYSSKFFDLIDLYANALEKNIHLCKCSEENKLWLSKNIGFIKKLCNLYKNFLSGESDEKNESWMKFCGKLCDSTKNSDRVWDAFIDNINIVKRKFIESSLSSDDDVKNFNSALIELVNDSQRQFNCSLSILKFYGIEEKISSSDISEGQKEYLRNSINLIGYVYDKGSLCCELEGLFGLSSFIFDPAINFNQKYRKFIDFISSELGRRDDYSSKFFELIDLYANALEKNIHSCRCSEGKKLWLSENVDFIKNLCDLYRYFLSSKSDEKDKNWEAFCRDLSRNAVYGSDKSLTDLVVILNVVKHRIIDNKLSSDDDSKDFSAAFTEIVNYNQQPYHYDILSILNFCEIDKKISMASISIEEKKYLINIVKCIKFFNDNKIEIKGAKLAQVAFEPIVNFNQTQIKCIEAIDEIIYLVYYLKNQGWRSEYSEMFSMYLNEFNKRISLCICNDEEKRHLFNYFNFMTSLIDYLKEDSHENKYCDYKKIDPILEQLNEILKIEKFSDYIKDFMEHESFFHLVKKCFQHNKLETDDDFNEVNSVITEILRCKMQRNYCSAACLIENLSEEKISNSRLTDEQKESLINRIKFIKFYNDDFEELKEKLFSFIFDTVTDFNQMKEKCKSFIDAFISCFDECYVMSLGQLANCFKFTRSTREIFEAIDICIIELKKSIRVCSCSDEEKKHLLNYTVFIESLNVLTRKYFFAEDGSILVLENGIVNKNYVYKDIEIPLEHIKRIINIEEFSVPTKEFIKFITIFQSVRRCIEFYPSSAVGVFNAYNSVFAELGKYLLMQEDLFDKEKYLKTGFIMKKNLDYIEAAISDLSLTAKEKEHLINRITYILTINYYQFNNMKGKYNSKGEQDFYKKLLTEIDPNFDDFNKFLYDLAKRRSRY